MIIFLFWLKCKIKSSVHGKLQTSLKEIKDDLIEWEDIACTWIRRFNSIKVALFPQFIRRCNSTPVRIPAGSIRRSGNADPKIDTELPGTPNSQNNTEKEKQCWFPISKHTTVLQEPKACGAGKKEHLAVHLHESGWGNGFLEITPTAQQPKKRSRSCGRRQNKNFCTSKCTTKKVIRWPTEWEKDFVN